eukprot:scaffold1501_cov352-Pavlova_lutheri.AAC.7
MQGTRHGQAGIFPVDPRRMHRCVGSIPGCPWFKLDGPAPRLPFRYLRDVHGLLFMRCMIMAFDGMARSFTTFHGGGLPLLLSWLEVGRRDGPRPSSRCEPGVVTRGTGSTRGWFQHVSQGWGRDTWHFDGGEDTCRNGGSTWTSPGAAVALGSGAGGPRGSQHPSRGHQGEEGRRMP